MAKAKPKGRVNRIALALSVILLIALLGSVAANLYASGQTDIFSRVGYGASLQNSQILVDEALDIIEDVVKRYVQ